MRLLAISFILAGGLLTGCSDSSSNPKTYTTPKEPILTQDPAPELSKPPLNQMGSGNLPPSSMAKTDDPTWIKPQEWKEKPSNSVRRGSFAYGPNDEVDISITAFPGDVGGLLANVNRWRNQIQLPPIQTEEALAELITTQSWDYFSGTWIELNGETVKTLAVITLIDGNSWFFKITGPIDLVDSQKTVFSDFLNTVKFPNHE